MERLQLGPWTRGCHLSWATGLGPARRFPKERARQGRRRWRRLAGVTQKAAREGAATPACGGVKDRSGSSSGSRRGRAFPAAAELQSSRPRWSGYGARRPLRTSAAQRARSSRGNGARAIERQRARDSRHDSARKPGRASAGTRAASAAPGSGVATSAGWTAAGKALRDLDEAAEQAQAPRAARSQPTRRRRAAASGGGRRRGSRRSGVRVPERRNERREPLVRGRLAEREASSWSPTPVGRPRRPVACAGRRARPPGPRSSASTPRSTNSGLQRSSYAGPLEELAVRERKARLKFQVAPAVCGAPVVADARVARGRGDGNRPRLVGGALSAITSSKSGYVWRQQRGERLLEVTLAVEHRQAELRAARGGRRHRAGSAGRRAGRCSGERRSGTATRGGDRLGDGPPETARSGGINVIVSQPSSQPGKVPFDLGAADPVDVRVARVVEAESTSRIVPPL